MKVLNSTDDGLMTDQTHESLQLEVETLDIGANPTRDLGSTSGCSPPLTESKTGENIAVEQKFRICTKCSNKKCITEYHKKGHRIESQCKMCVGKRKKKNALQKKKALNNSKTTYSSVVIGELQNEVLTKFANAVASSIQELIDANRIY
jgi:hypothetical protein